LPSRKNIKSLSENIVAHAVMSMHEAEFRSRLGSGALFPDEILTIPGIESHVHLVGFKKERVEMAKDSLLKST
jgi:hypothetical protein